MLKGSRSVITVTNSEGKFVLIDKGAVLSNLKIMGEHTGLDKEWHEKVYNALDDFIQKNPNQSRAFESFEVDKFVQQTKTMKPEEKEDLKGYVLDQAVKGADIIEKLFFLQGIISEWKNSSIAHFVRDAASQRKKLPLPVQKTPEIITLQTKTKEQLQQEEEDYLLALALAGEDPLALPTTTPAAAAKVPTESMVETDEEKHNFLAAFLVQTEDSITLFKSQNDDAAAKMNANAARIDALKDKVMEIASVILFELKLGTADVEKLFMLMEKYEHFPVNKPFEPTQDDIDKLNIIYVYKDTKRAYSLADFEQFMLSRKESKKDTDVLTTTPSLTPQFDAESGAARTREYKPKRRTTADEDETQVLDKGKEEIETEDKKKEKDEKETPKRQRGPKK